MSYKKRRLLVGKFLFFFLDNFRICVFFCYFSLLGMMDDVSGAMLVVPEGDLE